MLYSVIRNILFSRAFADAESAHDFALGSLRLINKIGLGKAVESLYADKIPAKPVHMMGLEFKNPVGLAAGLDKNADYLDALAALGFGFIEVGTVTLRPQQGNDRPRLFRISEEQAIINRFGFNSRGVDYVIGKVQQAAYNGILGINIGKNKLTPNAHALADYLSLQAEVYPFADYISVNISSPNTPNLRALQQASLLAELIRPLKEQQQKLADLYARYVPLLVKIAPDLTQNELTTTALTLCECEVDGIICANTTLSRPLQYDYPSAQEAGGLSGAPLLALANQCLQQLRSEVGKTMPIIGVGGIVSASDAQSKLAAGADLLQIYSGFIYHGPKLIRDCVHIC